MITIPIANDKRVLEAVQEYHRVRRIYENTLAELDTEIKPYLEAVKDRVCQFGGYDQDGIKAYFEKRISYEYSVERVQRVIPEWANNLIVPTIDKKKIEALAKGGLINQDQLEQCREVVKEVEAFVCPLPKTGDKPLDK